MLRARTEPALARRSYGVRVGEDGIQLEKDYPNFDLDLALGSFASRSLRSASRHRSH
jgi:hypothetical protein